MQEENLALEEQCQGSDSSPKHRAVPAGQVFASRLGREKKLQLSRIASVVTSCDPSCTAHCSSSIPEWNSIKEEEEEHSNPPSLCPTETRDRVLYAAVLF